MNRVEIKELAKQKIKGNKWNIWWPIIVIGVIFGILEGAFGPKYNINPTTFAVTQEGGNAFLSLIVSFVEVVVTTCYMKYIINFVRTGKFETNLIIETLKARWAQILIADILVGVLVTLGSILFVIPGIILAFSYAMVTYLIVDTDLSAQDAMKKSREMMKGYKLDFFVFGLSFIGWALLTPFTLGLLFIWLYPYMLVATVIYYDRLKNGNQTIANSNSVTE